MFAMDFEYDGHKLSDYGFVICKFDGSGDTEVKNGGSMISFETVSHNQGKYNSLISASYNECLETTFDICKNPCNNNNYIGIGAITSNEYRNLMRWLNRREFLKFRLVDSDISECYFYGSFNVEKILIADELYGLRLTLHTNAPFGYGQEVVFDHTFSDIGTAVVFEDVSDEIGFIYPNVTITCLDNGDLEIANVTYSSSVSIKNCQQGEIINLKGKERIIESSVISHNITNDFNFEFLKIGNTFDGRDNEIATNKSCNIQIRYNPIIKESI